jgi:hypothetical protein
MFWQLYFNDNNALSQLADRVLYILANSVPCERAFSALNQLYTKTRNALTPERVNKSLYIQINRRTLRRDALAEKLLEDEDEDEEQWSLGSGWPARPIGQARQARSPRPSPKAHVACA